MPRSKNAASETVLVVDDDPDIRESLTELLDEKGYSVLQAENGRKAIEVLKSAPRAPCVVVLDLAMPVLDGREFLRRRASDPVLVRIPVVVLSGSAQSPPLLGGIEAYLRKPVNPDLLLRIIRKTYDEWFPATRSR